MLLINGSSYVSGHLECNYAKGKWVIDHNRPLYSGFGCKQHLSGMWACRLTQRTDFAYESMRWQLKNCQMEEFEGLKFLRRYYHILRKYLFRICFSSGGSRYSPYEGHKLISHDFVLSI